MTLLSKDRVRTKVDDCRYGCGRKMLSRRCACEIKSLRTGGVQRKWALTVGGGNGAERKKKVTADANKKDPKGKVKVTDVRTKARPSSRCLGPATKYFGRDLIFKGAAPDKSRGYRAHTDDCRQRIEDGPLQTACNTTETRHNSPRNRREPRPALVLKLANGQRGYRKVVVMNHGRPMTSEVSRGPPVSEVCSVSLVRGTSTVSAARPHPVCFPLQTLETSPQHIAALSCRLRNTAIMTILSTQITSTTTRVSGSHSRNHHATFGSSLMGVQLNMRHSRHLNMTKDGTRT